MSVPAISIITPVYNVELYIDRFINSFLNQSFKDFELVCVDDGSTDQSGEILKSYAAKDSRIKIFSQENQGAAIARNRGLAEASGNYITFADADDAVEPQCLEIAMYAMNQHQADMVCFNRKVHVEHLKTPDYHQFNMEAIPARLVSNPVVTEKLSSVLWDKLYTKELLEGISFIPGIFHDDLPFIYEVLARRPKTVLLDVALYFYTVNPTSITLSKKTLASIANHRKGLERIDEVYSRSGLEKEYKAVKNLLIPNVLSYARSRCLQTPLASDREDMLKAFADLLWYLKARKMISWSCSLCWNKGLYTLLRTVVIYWRNLRIMRDYPASHE